MDAYEKPKCYKFAESKVLRLKSMKNFEPKKCFSDLLKILPKTNEEYDIYKEHFNCHYKINDKDGKECKDSLARPNLAILFAKEAEKMKLNERRSDETLQNPNRVPKFITSSTSQKQVDDIKSSDDVNDSDDMKAQMM